MAKGDKAESFVTEITPRSEDFSRWYLDVVRRAELADYTPVKGCMVPIPRGNWRETVLPVAQEIERQLVAGGIRVTLDARDSYTPGWMFAEWEMRGVPLRLEIGPKDIEKSSVLVRNMPMKAVAPSGLCVRCDSPAQAEAWFAKAY